MKKDLLLFTAIFFMATSSFATVHTVSAGGMAFTPSTGVIMHPGDTIMWVWHDGVHTTTSTSSIPAGAASWNANLSSTATSFIYVPTVLGTYNYQCNYHVSMGMVGTFSVVSSTGITLVNATTALAIYPNPASGSVHVQFNSPQAAPVSLSLTDLNGKDVLRKDYATLKETDLELKNIPGGTYIITVKQGGKTYKQELTVSH